MGLADSRQIKSFTEVVTKIWTPDGSPEGGKWTSTADTPIDDQINQWVESAGAVILQISATWSQLSDQLPNGKLVRRAITRYVVIYTTERDYFETEARVRKMALLGEGLTPQVISQGPVPESHMPPPAQPRHPVDSDAGGPPGTQELFDNEFFRGAGHSAT